MSLQNAVMAVLAAAFAAACAFAVGHSKGFRAGEASERLKWQTRESDELRAAQAALVDAQLRAAALEQDAAARIAALDADHLTKEKALEAQHDRFLDDLSSGRVRLFTAATACQGAHGVAQGAPAAAAGVDDAAAQRDVPRALRAAVAGGAALAAEADQVAEQLAGAQRYIETVLKVCR